MPPTLPGGGARGGAFPVWPTAPAGPAVLRGAIPPAGDLAAVGCVTFFSAEVPWEDAIATVGVRGEASGGHAAQARRDRSTARDDDDDTQFEADWESGTESARDKLALRLRACSANAKWTGFCDSVHVAL